MSELSALIESVNQLNRNYEEANDELCALRADIKKNYVPRKEVDERAAGIRKWIAGMLIAGMIVAASAFTGWYVNHRESLYNKELAEKNLANCEQTREGLRNVIEIAVADRRPLSSSTPETVAAIEAENVNRIRPLRERLLSLDGTKPELCR